MYDCIACKSRLSTKERATLGCAFVPGAKGAQPVRGARVDATVCPGYSTSLPVVHEIASCRSHWDKGSLELRLHGHTATRLLMQYIELAAGALGSCEAYFMKPKEER